MQIIVLLCEGHHDVAFISRILKTINFKSYDSTKIARLPSPMSNMLIAEVEKSDVEELNLIEARRSLLPAAVLKREANIGFLYSLGGDCKKPSRIKILQSFKDFVPKEGEIDTDRISHDTTLSILYLLDADEQGVNQRLNSINLEIKEVFNELQQDPLTQNADFVRLDKIKIGAYIFTDKNDRGKLEDILLPLMQSENEQIFNAATEYLDTYFEDDRLFRMRLSWADSQMTESRSTANGDKEKYDSKKSLIGVVGQLQRSGKSNVVCINDCDYITLNKIKENIKCKEIVGFLEHFFE